LLRPDPQAIWRQDRDLFKERGLNAIYERSSDGGGRWRYLAPMPEEFTACWRDLVFHLKLMGFKHTGVFPEQAANWATIIELIQGFRRECAVLNLFAYTGGATLAALSAGARVTHVDSAKAMCARAKQNVLSSKLDTDKVRFIVDDCFKFVQKEIRRGKRYDAVIMDPPSYGRGPAGEKWKLEEALFDLVRSTKEILSDNPLFYLLNSYTTGLQPAAISNVLKSVFKDKNHSVTAYEVGIEEESGLVLPCGCSALMRF
jgi:23S rRNA (cytosine1962-C5)-methyltransferase